MYLDFFNLKEQPFSLAPDPKFLLRSKEHDTAIQNLVFGIRERKGFLMLTGEIGTGKSLICREIIIELSGEVDFSFIFNPYLSVNDLLQSINSDFGNTCKSTSDKKQLDTLNEFLLEKASMGRICALIIDEAHNLSFTALEMIRMLSNLEIDGQKLLQIILVGQPELDRKLKSSYLRQLNQRINVRRKLRVLTYNESCDYIFHRLTVAGGEGHISFEKKALKELYRHTSGYPRLLNIICDRALLEAYASGNKVVSKRMARTAIIDVNGGKQQWYYRMMSWLSL